MAGWGSYLYKTDLSRGYRQLRIDPLDWPYLAFKQGSRVFMDVCPPFGLRSSAMAMQRVSQAIIYLHSKRGFSSRAYIDDFGGVEPEVDRARQALGQLQDIMDGLGVRQAEKKICQPAQFMTWLGILPCPVAMAEALLARAAARLALPTSPLFACWQGVGTQPLSLSQGAARRFLAITLRALGQPPSQFTFHSFRRGGCTHAFAGGALLSDLALHGDWSSDAIRRYYPRSLAQLRVADILASTPLNLPIT